MVSSANHLGVTLKGIYFEDFLLTVVLKSGITVNDIGKAVTKDGTVVNGYKLTGDGDPIHGRLESVENRLNEGTLIGTVAFKFAETLPIKTGETVLVGDTVIGSSVAGEVKSAVTTALATADAATQGVGYVQADVQSITALANALKAKLNTLITYRSGYNMVVEVVGLVATVIKI